jgi:hypothetical protein
MIGLNSNGHTKLQTKRGQSLVQLLVTNPTLMDRIKNFMIHSHKAAHTSPESHDPARSSTMRMISGIEGNFKKYSGL